MPRPQTPRHPVGIDDLNLYSGTLCVDLAALAEFRAVSDQLLSRIGFTRKSIVPAWEDPVTLAVNAARPLVDAAPSPIGLLIVATESGLDDSKPLSTYVHRHLGLPSNCRNFEIKHACFAGVAALHMAAAWVREAPDAQPPRRALVVATDVGRPVPDGRAELSVGTGAAAVVVARDPGLIVLDGPIGTATREVHDVSRPTRTSDFADPILSIASYLDLLDGAWLGYRGAGGGNALDHLVFHAPVLDLVRQAYQQLGADAGAWPIGDQDFEQRVGPSLRFTCELANTYSANVFGGLAGLLADGTVAEHSTVGVFSYGSGACAEFFGGRLASGAARWRAGRDIAGHLGQRRSVSPADYLRLQAEVAAMSCAVDKAPSYTDPEGLFDSAYAGRRRLVLEAVRNHHRSYAVA